MTGIRTHDPSVRERENCSRLRPRGHYDRKRVLWQSSHIQLPAYEQPASHRLVSIASAFRAHSDLDYSVSVCVY
jgi:hypothetical protein